MFELCTHRFHSEPDTERDKKKHTNTIFLHLQFLYNLPQTLHDGRARRAHPKRCQPFFDPIHIFSAKGQNVDFRPVNKFNTGSLRFAQSCR